MTDVLDELHLAIANGADQHLIQCAIQEIEDRRAKVTELKARCTELVLENRDLKAIVNGHPVVRIKRMGSPDLPLPRYETDGAAGMDLRADVKQTGRSELTMILLRPCERALIPCGFAFEIPDGFEGQVRGRSSFTKRGILCPTGTRSRLPRRGRGLRGKHVRLGRVD